MPEFEYSGVSKDQYKSGTIFAGTLDEAQTVLSEQGITVVRLRPRRPIELGVFNNILASLQKGLRERMSSQEKILFTSQLASMIKAGLPLIDALATFVDTKVKSGSVVIINKVMQDVQAGVKLSDSLARFPKIFNPAYLSIVKAGENSGTLDSSLEYLAELLRRENALVTKVRSALIYPAVVVTAMIAVMIFISVSIIPKILVFAESSGQALPIYTQVLIFAVSFFTNYWYLILMFLVLLIVAATIFVRSENGSRWVGMMSLRMPIIGPVVSRYNIARFARVLGGFYNYGVNIVTSFDILAQSLDNPLFRDACLRIKNQLTVGTSLADAIAEEQDLFPPIMTRLIKGAEKTGNIGNTLDKLAHFYEEELENILSNLLALIEPVMVFVLGFGVLGLALAVILPIYSITSSL